MFFHSFESVVSWVVSGLFSTGLASATLVSSSCGVTGVAGFCGSSGDFSSVFLATCEGISFITLVSTLLTGTTWGASFCFLTTLTGTLWETSSCDISGLFSTGVLSTTLGSSSCGVTGVVGFCGSSGALSSGTGAAAITGSGVVSFFAAFRASIAEFKRSNSFSLFSISLNIVLEIFGLLSSGVLSTTLGSSSCGVTGVAGCGSSGALSSGTGEFVSRFWVLFISSKPFSKVATCSFIFRSSSLDWATASSYPLIFSGFGLSFSTIIFFLSWFSLIAFSYSSLFANNISSCFAIPAWIPLFSNSESISNAWSSEKICSVCSVSNFSLIVVGLSPRLSARSL